MTDDDILEQGRAALHAFRDEALHDGATWTVFGNDRHLENAFRLVLGMIDAGQPRNPAYCTHLMAAGLAVLARDRPEAYAKLVGAIAPAGRAVSPGTADGMVLLMNLVNSVGDDHDYSLDRSGESAVIRRQDDMPAWTPGTNPRELAEAVRPLLAGCPPAPGM